MNDAIDIKKISSKVTSFGKKLLKYMYKKEYVTIQEIQSLFDVKTNKLFSEMIRLESACLIDCENNESDNRKKLFYITDEGINSLKYLND